MKNLEIEKGIRHLSDNDERLALIIEKAGRCRLKAHSNYFLSLLDAIISQQLSVKAAASILKRFIEHYNGAPDPEKILAEDPQILRQLGLSNAKVKYVKDLSEKIINRELSFRGIPNKTESEIIESLIRVKGIGEWTAHMFLIFTLARPDILPVGDLGIKRAIMINYGLDKMPDEKTVFRIAKKYRWSPYSTIASWYLWKSLEF